MTFIDLDGVLADLEKWCIELEPTVFDTRANFHKFASKHYKQLFLESSVITDNLHIFDKHKNKGFRVLTALPDLDSFIKHNIEEYNLDTLLEMHRTFKENKLAWLYNKLNIPPYNVLCVNNSNEKQLYCINKEDTLYDDYEKNIEEWNQKGGNGILVEYKHHF